MVGAGPGDPDLITVKAKRLLSQCEAIVYDALIPKEILDLANNHCECIFVGKRRGHHSTVQSKTNKLLLDLAKRYKSVVRLKGGDPFVFGRGGEEADYLQRHGISIEIVPGITAGIAAPAYFGIPLTHRLGASSVTFVTGHEGVDKQRPLVNWKALAKATDTLVIYMGVHNLPHIVQRLLEAGLPPKTPSAVIQQGTVSGQLFITTTIDNLVEQVKQKNLVSPSIIIIGEVVNLRVKSCSSIPANITMPILF